MKEADLIHSFEFPEKVFVNHRVPKKLLIERGAPTNVEKHQIQNGIDDLLWIASLKPTTIGIATYSDNKREVLEIAVLYMKVRPEGKVKRLIEFAHRAIPYPIILITEHDSTLILSLADKRGSESEKDKTVIDGEIIKAHLNENINIEICARFRKALNLTCQPQNSLYHLYQGWIDTLLALQIAGITGTFAVPTTNEHAICRKKALYTCIALERKIADLHTAVAKEKQLAKQVDLNLEFKRLQAEYTTAYARL